MISSAISSWGANFVAFSALGVLFFLPVIALSALIAFDALALPEPTLGGARSLKELALNGVQFLGGLILGPCITGAVVYGVIRQRRGEPATMGECMAHGISQLGSVLLVGLAQGLASALPLVVGGVALALAIAFDLGAGAIAGSVLLALAGAVGSIAIAMALWVAVPAAVVEQLSVGEAFRRSLELTRGQRMTVFGAIFVMGLLAGVFGFFTGLLTGLVTVVAPAAGVIAALVFDAILAALPATLQAVGYHELRIDQEGDDVADLLAAFD